MGKTAISKARVSRAISALLVAALVTACVPATALARTDFLDMPDQSYWGYTYIDAASELGYMTGYDNGTFGPEDLLTRADAAMVLYKMAGVATHVADDAGELTYTDVASDAYYAEAVLWATSLGIVSGDEDADGTALNTFRPTDSVTREEFAKMLYVYQELLGNTYDVDVDAVLSSYADGEAVSAWARGYVAWLAAAQIMGVDSDLNPTGTITRAEVAAMSVRVQPTGQLDDACALAHSWVASAETEEVWVVDVEAYEEEVWIVDVEAYTETVYTGVLICSCGEEFPISSDNSAEVVSAWDEHVQDEFKLGNYVHSYTTKVTGSEMVYHDEVGHYETVSYEEVGHYETVPAGYTCSICGETM